MRALRPKPVDFLIALATTVLGGQLLGIAWQATLLVLVLYVLACCVVTVVKLAVHTLDRQL
jgi:hypothetical protein